MSFLKPYSRALAILAVSAAALAGAAAQPQPKPSGRLIELLDDALAGAESAVRAHQAAPNTTAAQPSPQTSSGAGSAGAAGSGADAGAESYGYWAVSEGADGVKVGVVFPAYSPTEFVGAVLYCIPNSGVRITLDTAKSVPAGSKADVAITVGDATARYRGVAQDKATEDGGAVVVETSTSDPIFEELAGGKPFSFVVAGEKASLPTRNSQNAFRRFLDRCRS
ncbi:MAG: hypothetical protein KDJ20_14485 [Hyphomicrobiales bacterium]|nr:hypothetical protein [Hyphomicrobiales bacterium]